MLRFFRKTNRRFDAEEFGRDLAQLAEKSEKTVAASFTDIGSVPNPDALGVALISVAAVIWETGHNPFVSRLPADRFQVLINSYYADVWRRITSRFGVEREQYNEFVRCLGGVILPDYVKTESVRRTGLHEIVGMVVGQIGGAADEWLANVMSGENSSMHAKEQALGDAVRKVAFRSSGAPDYPVSIAGYTAFMAIARGVKARLESLDNEGYQLV
jgi:hypothetical protein